jgi:hypothetical protein
MSEGELARISKQLEALKKRERDAVLAGRKAAIETECAKHSNRAIRRNLSHNLEGLNLVRDAGMGRVEISLTNMFNFFF